VGVGVGAVLVLGIGCGVLFMRGRRKRDAGSVTTSMAEMDDQSSELKSYVGGRWRTEVDGKSGV
jgi:hypothetical protein